MVGVLLAPRVTPDQLCTRASGTGWLNAVVQFPLTRLVIGTACLALAFALASPLLIPGQVIGRLLHPLALIGLGLCAYLGYVRFVERRPAIELSRACCAGEWMSGALLGAGLMASTVGILAVLGTLRIAPSGYPLALILTGAPAFAASALLEELAFRALLFKLCEESAGTWIALAVQAALFGALHMINPHATIAGAAAIALEAGGLLGAAFILTRRIWFVWGIHFAWNFTEAGIFGSSVSGSGRAHGIFVLQRTGPTWLTGGSFGVEASPIAVLACLVATLFLLQLGRKRDQVVPLRGVRRGRPARESA